MDGRAVDDDLLEVCCCSKGTFATGLDVVEDEDCTANAPEEELVGREGTDIARPAEFEVESVSADLAEETVLSGCKVGG